ncbi:MAG: HEAT repeat domain-containing protein, partial [Elusimicrobiota bacterium]
LGKDAAPAVDDLLEQFEKRREGSLRQGYLHALGSNADGKRAGPKLLSMLRRERDFKNRESMIASRPFVRLARGNKPLFEPLRDCLHSDDTPAFRGTCAKLLGLVDWGGPSRAVADLSAAVLSDEDAIYRGAMRGLHTVGKEAKTAIPQVLASARKHPERNAYMIQFLGFLGESGQVPADARERVAAADRLAKERRKEKSRAALGKRRAAIAAKARKKRAPRYKNLGGKKTLSEPHMQSLGALPKLIRSSKDAKWRAGAFSFMIFKGKRSRFLIPFAAEMLDKKKHPDRPSFRAFLRSAGPPGEGELDGLSKLLDHPSAAARFNAVLALRAMGSGARPAFRRLAGAARAAKGNARMLYARTMLAVSPLEARPLLIEFMNGAVFGSERAAYARMALDAGAGEDARKYLVDLARTGEPLAVLQLTQSKAAEFAVPLLIDNLILGRGIELTNIYALASIGRKSASAVPLLTERLTSESPAIRSAAAYALGRIGPAASPALKSLKKCGSDPSLSVRRHAEVALQAISIGKDKPWWVFW